MAKNFTDHVTPAGHHFLDAVFDDVTEAVVGIDPTSRRVVHWNKAAAIAFDQPANRIVGKTIDMLNADKESLESLSTLLSEAQQYGSRRTKWEICRHDGWRFSADVTATLARRAESGDEYVILVLRQAAHVQDTQSDLESYAHRQEILAEIGQEALGNAEIDDLMDRGVREIAAALDADYCSVLELLPGGEEMLLRAAAGWEDGQVGQIRIAVSANSPEGYALLSEKPVMIENVRHESRFAVPPTLHDRDIVSGISAVIRGRTRPYGVLSAYATRRRLFTRDDMHFFVSIADLFANTIERKRIDQELQSLNARLFEIVRERTKLIQLQREAWLIANQASTVDEALDATMNKLCKETSFPCPETSRLVGHIYRAMTTDVTPRADYWYLSNPETLAPFRALSETIRFEHGAGLIGRVLASRKLEWVADFARDQTDSRAAAAKDAGLKTAVAFPVLANDDVVAVMEIFTSETLTPEAPLLDALSQIGIELGGIVERKRTEERLRQNELLATIGLTAAKLAHEISNPLNGMYTAMQLLEQVLKDRKLAQDDFIPATIRDLKKELDRLRVLLQEFRTLSRPMKFDFEIVDVSEIAREVANFELPRYAQQGITITFDFPADLPKANVDGEKIKQALLNLCQNAADAMPNGGTLTVRGYKLWEALCIEVHDTGAGLPERMNVFDIFTTTKRSGTGLGLPIVQQIVSGHSGGITVSSEPGKGTMFRLTLPINAKKAALASGGRADDALN